MTTPHADALAFLLSWYQLPPEGRHAPSNITAAVEEATQIADFLALDRSQDITVVVLRFGSITEQGTGLPVAHPHRVRGEAMQLTDTQQVTFTIDAEDSKGNAVAGDTFTASVDNTAVVTVSGPDAGGVYTVAAQEPGVGAILTVTDGAGITVTESFDVVAGSVATISLTFTDPTDEPAPAPVTPVDPNAPTV